MTKRLSKEEYYAERDRRSKEQLRQISGMLQGKVEYLAPLLLPEGARAGHDWRAGDSGALSIKLTGPKAGVFRDFRKTKGTDMLGAIQQLLCDGDFGRAVEWAKSYLGMEQMSDDDLNLATKKAAQRVEQSKKDDEIDDKKRRGQAAAIWHGADPLEGTLAERYLAARGIHLNKLKRAPGALRFSNEVWCRIRKGKYPAMVSSMWRLGEPKMACVHRTFLTEGVGGAGKADIDPCRSVLGSWPGAVLPIQRGEGDRRWKDIAEGDLVALGEGIEEGLSIALVKPEWRVGAVGFVGGFAQIELPVWCHLMLCANNDPEKSQAALGLQDAVRVLEDKGHVVRVLYPPKQFKDWNDLLMGKSIE